MELRNRIKGLRKLKNYTLQELGNKVGVTASTVRKWESGEIETIRSDKIDSLAKALDVSPAYLLGWTEEMGHYNSVGDDPRLFIPMAELSDKDIEELLNDPSWMNNKVEEHPDELSPYRRVITEGQLKEEETELVKIYRGLDLRRRIKLLNYAMDLETEK